MLQLLGVLAVDVAAFQISNDSSNAFFLTELGRQLVACSSIFGSLGFFVAMGFSLRYSLVTPDRFREVALDINGTYVTFCFTARLPMGMAFVSIASLVVWIISMAYQAWPIASIVLSLLVGMCFGLGWAIYLCTLVVRVGTRIGKRTRNAIVWLGGRMLFWRTQKAADAQEEQDSLSTSLTPMATPPPVYTAALTLSPPTLHIPWQWQGRLSPLSSLIALPSSPSTPPDVLSDAPDITSVTPVTPVRPPKNPKRKAVICR